MPQGKIKKLVTEKGFGFIEMENGKDIFFHASNVQDEQFDSLREGEQLEFEIGQGDKGPRAENVRKA